MRAITRTLLAFLLAVASASAATATPDDQALVKQVRQAVQTADVPALAAIYQKPNDAAARTLAAMGLERIHGNDAASSADAAVCERALVETRPELAYFCAIFANGNLRLREGDAVANRDEAAIARRFDGRIPQARLDDMRARVVERRDDPVFTITLPDTGFTLPLVRAPGDDRGAVEVVAGDARARLVVDTGGGRIVLDEATAKRLGVHLLGRRISVNGAISHDITMQAGFIDRLTLGPVTLHHVPVAVATGRVNLIGLDVLKQLGAFRITRHAIDVYGTSQARPACTQPLLLASDVWGHSVRATVALPINGTLQTALIDTGSSAYLSGDKAAVDELALSYGHRVRLRDISGHARAARVGQANAEVRLAGHTINLTFGVFSDTSLPWHYVLGSGALVDMDFYFDFPGRHSCQLAHADLQ